MSHGATCALVAPTRADARSERATIAAEGRCDRYAVPRGAHLLSVLGRRSRGFLLLRGARALELSRVCRTAYSQTLSLTEGVPYERLRCVRLLGLWSCVGKGEIRHDEGLAIDMKFTHLQLHF